MTHISHNENKMIHDSKRLLDSGTIDDPVEVLRLMCLSRGLSGFLGFGRCFREMDNNGEKVLNLEQFTKAMHNTGFELSADQVEEIFNRFDMDGSGGINISNLMASIRPEMSNSRRSIVNTAFNKVDKLEAGTVSMNALKRCYNVHSNPRYVSGVQSEEVILQKFIAHFEEHGHVDAEITREDFENYYAALSASVDDDTYFDLVIRQVYKL